MFDLTQLRFERLGPIVTRFGFSCGYVELERFLTEDALGFCSEKLATTYVCWSGAELVGYVTWVADCIRLDETERKNFVERKTLLHEFPAMKIARLAVKSDCQGQGVGSLLIRVSLGHMLEWSRQFGCRFATVDAKPEALRFYERHGFVKNLHKLEKSRHTVSMRFDLLHYAP